MCLDPGHASHQNPCFHDKLTMPKLFTPNDYKKIDYPCPHFTQFHHKIALFPLGQQIILAIVNHSPRSHPTACKGNLLRSVPRSDGVPTAHLLHLE